MGIASGADGAFKRLHPSEGMRALERERALPLTGWQQEVEQGHRYGLEASKAMAAGRVDRGCAGSPPSPDGAGRWES